MTTFERAITVPALAAGLVGLCASPAAAHVTGQMSSLAGGLVHPLLGLDHLFALLAVGILAGLAGRGWSVALPVLFALSMGLGALMGLGAPESRLVEPAISASVVIFGLAVMRPDMLRAYAVTGIAVCLALIHGYAHGTEAPAVGAAPFIAGMAFTGFVLATAASWFIRHPVVKPRSWYLGAACSVAGLAMLIPSL